MRRLVLATVITVAVAAVMCSPQPSSAASGPAIANAQQGMIGDQNARKGMIVKVKKWRRGRGWRRGHRPWRKRRHYGSLLGGIVLGAIIAGAARHAYRPDYDDDLCWYWTSPYRTHGYWDYCY